MQDGAKKQGCESTLPLILKTSNSCLLGRNISHDVRCVIERSTTTAELTET